MQLNTLVSIESYPLLSYKTIITRLPQLNSWQNNNDTLERSFCFSSFKQTMRFVHDVAVVAENKNHHPEINICYTKVKLFLTTKDKNGITEKDFELAMEIDTLLQNNNYGMVHEK